MLISLASQATGNHFSLMHQVPIYSNPHGRLCAVQCFTCVHIIPRGSCKERANVAALSNGRSPGILDIWSIHYLHSHTHNTSYLPLLVLSPRCLSRQTLRVFNLFNINARSYSSHFPITSKLWIFNFNSDGVINECRKWNYSRVPGNLMRANDKHLTFYSSFSERKIKRTSTRSAVSTTEEF